ncbi:hypothetical protein CTI14_43535, partial [Methylobacterium radiotolerans]
EISWTFDPLISRNAHFNLVKLAAEPTSYHRNFCARVEGRKLRSAARSTGTNSSAPASGFFASPGRRALHSHIAGVSGRMRGRSVGFALKVHQRAWALSEGLEEISWTFDPLISRNAHFNLVKLAAEPTSYHRNF